VLFAPEPLELDKSLPTGLSIGTTVKFRDEVFAPNPIAGNLPLEQFRAGIGGRVGTDPALAATKDRDPIRSNVIEVAGSCNTSMVVLQKRRRSRHAYRSLGSCIELSAEHCIINLKDEEPARLFEVRQACKLFRCALLSGSKIMAKYRDAVCCLCRREGANQL
jgi:hypothetical protein